ncbi:MAG: hypothetical protein ACXW61_18140 [Gemmatirosa sp.]
MSQRTDSSLPPDENPSSDEPRRIDLGRRDFAGAGEFAADQRKQNAQRGEGLGAGGTDNRAARHPDSAGDAPEDEQD